VSRLSLFGSPDVVERVQLVAGIHHTVGIGAAGSRA
jgi:hypothetical protein